MNLPASIIRDEENLLIVKNGNPTFLYVGGFFVIIGTALLLVFNSQPNTLGPIFTSAFSLLIIFFGIISIVFTHSNTLTFDKHLNLLKHFKVSILGRKENKYNFNDIKNIELRKTFSGTGKSAGTGFGGGSGISFFYQLKVVLKNGKEISLTQNVAMATSEKGSLPLYELEKALGEKVSHFTNVSFVETGPTLTI